MASACVTLVIPLVLARMLPQADYGTYKLLFLVSMTAAAVLPCGVVQSLYFFVPRARDPRAYLGQTAAFMLGAGALGGLALWLASPLLAAALSTPGLLAHRAELAAYTALAVAAAPLEPSLTARGRTALAAATYLTSDALRALALVAPLLAGGDLHAMMRAMTLWAAARLAAAWAVTLAGGRGPLWDRALLRGQLAYALPFGLAIVFAVPQQYAHQFIVAHAVGPALFAVYAVACFELPFVDLFYTPTGEVLMVRLGELDRAGRTEEGAAAFREAVARLAALILPPIAFVWAIGPELVTTLFGARFAEAGPIFRVAVLAMPLGVWPVDATLRARGETRHILASYVFKAALSVPAAWLAVERFGLMGGAGAYVASEVLGRAFLAWRLPRALAAHGRRARAGELVPAARLGRTTLGAAALAMVGAGVYHLCDGLAPGAPLHRLFPLACASTVFGAGYLVHLVVGGTEVPGPLGALLARRRDRAAVSA